MLEKNKQNPNHSVMNLHLHPRLIWNRVKYTPERAVGGHPANVKRNTGRQEAWEPKICLVDTSGQIQYTGLRNK